MENNQKNAQQQQQEFPTFCYTTANVNMMGKLGEENKACYITQPFSYNYALVNQVQLNNTISNISFKCDVCGLMFGHLALLNAHKRIHNQDSETNMTLVSTAEAIPPHIQIVSPEPEAIPSATVSVASASLTGPNKCITCGNSIPNNPKRKGPKLIRCEICIANDNNSQRLPLTAAAAVVTDGVKFEVADRVQLVTQSQNNNQQQSQTKHEPGHYPVKKRNMASVTKCHKCNGSGIIFIGGNKNKMHLANVDKQYQCNICGGQFSRYSSLWSHKKLHSGEKNYKCSTCGLAFAKSVYLKNHMRIHTGEKPYRCNTCGMQFAQSPHLKNHERTHSGEKPYVCEVCDKGFARHATLWNHRRIHTGEKPYKCETCGSAFSQAAHLKNHHKVHSGEKPYKCDICTAAFADRFALKRHRGIHDKYGQTAPISSRIAEPNQVLVSDTDPLQ